MKKIVFLVLTLLLLTGLCLGIGFAAMAAESDGVNALEQSIMEGYALPEIPADAKPIGSYGEFMGMATDGVYYLTSDFKLPMSYLSDFEGTLYGNGHTLTVDQHPVFTSLNGATVRDLTVVGTVASPNAVDEYVGGLVRKACNSTIIGITNKADVTQDWADCFAGGVAGYAENTTFKYCSNYGAIKAARPGGIMGEINNASAFVVLENCINHGTVNGANQTGGLVSRAQSCDYIHIIDSANFGTVNVSWSDSGSVIGKIVGNEALLKGVYNSGTLNGAALCGMLAYADVKDLTFDDCHNGCFVDTCTDADCEHGAIKQRRIASDIGAFIGQSHHVSEGYTITVANCTNTADVITTFSSRTGGLCGVLGAETVTIRNCVNSGNVGSANYSAGIVGRCDSVDMILIENVTNNGNVTVTASYGGGIIGYHQYGDILRMIGVTNNGTITTTWNAGGLLCRVTGHTGASEMSFTNCTNNGNIYGNGGTAGGILGIMEPGAIDIILALSFNSCKNTGTILAPNYTGGMTGISWAQTVTMTNCQNSGNMLLIPEKDEYAEVGGLAGRIYGTLTAIDCVNSGNVYDASSPRAEGTTKTIVIGGIVGRVGQDGKEAAQKAQGATFIRCVNTGVLGGSKAIVDAATTYSVAAGGIAGDVNGKAVAQYCVSAGAIFASQNAGGITVWAGQNEVVASTYEGCIVTADIYSSGTRVADLWGGPAGISNYVFGNANVYRCTITGDITLASTNGCTDTAEGRAILTALIGYTNNYGGKFQYNYFTGKLIAGEGVYANTSFIGNTRNCDVASDEGGDIIHNYSLNEYALHYNSTKTWSDTKTTSITAADMVKLHSDLRLITACDGTQLPAHRATQSAWSQVMSLQGHSYGENEATADASHHRQVCACGATVYLKHTYENACDTTCDDCGYERAVADHVGEFACSAECKFCGVALTEVEAHTPQFLCSESCMICGVAVEAAEHAVSSECDTACDLCGATVAATGAHTPELPCGGTCTACGADAEGVAHQGTVACSPICQWCGTAVAGAEHEGEYACSTTCKHCGTPIWGEDHVGVSDCATVCQYCECELEPTAEHEGAYACSTVCKHCGTSMEGICEGEYACSVLCKYCGSLIVPAMDHTATHACSTACALCGAALTESAEHTYENACDVDCDVCGAVRTNNHVYSRECDADCNICGYVRNVNHGGEYLCSDTCRWCGVEITPASAHMGAVACAENCKWCGELIDETARQAHTYAHNCDSVCDICYAERTVEPHVGEYSCSEVCKWCGATIYEPGSHAYDNSCDASCNNCGYNRLNAKHAFDNNCDTECNKGCGYVRETQHKFDNDCDTDCNVCGLTRETQHVYDNACDQVCNVCGKMDITRDHAWEAACDTKCDVCGTTRDTSHEFEGCSGICTKCEKQIRDDAHAYGDWTVTVPATAEADGSRERVCANCNEKETEVITRLAGNSAGNQAGDTTSDSGSGTVVVVIVIVVAVVAVAVVVIAVVLSKKKKKKDDDEEA